MLSVAIHATFIIAVSGIASGRDAAKRIPPSPVYVELMSEPAPSAPQRRIIAKAGSMPFPKSKTAPSPPVSPALLSNQTELKAAATAVVAEPQKEDIVLHDKQQGGGNSGRPQGFNLIESSLISGEDVVPSTYRHEDIQSSVVFVPGTDEERGKGHADAVAAIRAAIERAKSYPQTAKRRGMEGTATVEFSINTKGMPEHIKIVTSSGSAILDSAAHSTIARAAPFPPYVGIIQVPITFRLEKED